MSTLHLHTEQAVGRIKPMHAVGQPPFGGGPGYKNYRHFHYLTEIGTPYARLHDVGGVFGGNRYVDVPNIFRDFDADENDPASYDFAFTDALLENLVKAGVEPYYRLGVTIENHVEVKAYRIYPPKDFEKWARICEHIIAHYNEGWANGYHFGITYWEIWNEPDGDSCDERHLNMNWGGTAEQFYRLYEVTAKHLKACFPNIKVGGYGAIGFQGITDKIFGVDPGSDGRPEPPQYWIDFFHGFLGHVKKTGAPLDFFSFHCYRYAHQALVEAAYAKEQLTAYGYGNAELHLNEWNPNCYDRGTARHGANTVAMMLALQNSPVDKLMFYDAAMGGFTYAGLFDPRTYKPWHAYYALAAFNHLYQLGDQCALTVEDAPDGLYAVAATDADRTHGALVISNVSGQTLPLTVDGVDLTHARWYVLDEQRLLSWSPAVQSIPNHTVVLVTY